MNKNYYKRNNGSDKNNAGKKSEKNPLKQDPNAKSSAEIFLMEHAKGKTYLSEDVLAPSAILERNRIYNQHYIPLPEEALVGISTHLDKPFMMHAACLLANKVLFNEFIANKDRFVIFYETPLVQETPVVERAFRYLLSLNSYQEYSYLKFMEALSELCPEFEVARMGVICEVSYNINLQSEFADASLVLNELCSYGFISSTAYRTYGSLNPESKTLMVDEILHFQTYKYHSTSTQTILEVSTGAATILDLTQSDDLKNEYVQSSMDVLNASNSRWGVPRGQMIMVCAAPGCGKSLFLEQEAIHFSRQGLKVHLLVMGDLTRKALMIRLMALASGQSLSEVELSPERVRWVMGDELWKNLRITVQPANVLNVEDYVEYCLSESMQDIDVFLIDYDKNFAETKDSMYQQGRDIYNTLTALTQRGKLVMVAAQPKNEYFKAEKLPMNAVAESSGKTHVVDTVITFGKMQEHNETGRRIGSMVVRKNRHGKSEEARFWVSDSSGRFVMLSQADFLKYREGLANIEEIDDSHVVNTLEIGYWEEQLLNALGDAESYVRNADKIIDEIVNAGEDRDKVLKEKTSKAFGYLNVTQEPLTPNQVSEEIGNLISNIVTARQDPNYSEKIRFSKGPLPIIDINEYKCHFYNRDDVVELYDRYNILRILYQENASVVYRRYLSLLHGDKFDDEICRTAIDFNVSFENAYQFIIVQSSPEGHMLNPITSKNQAYLDWVNKGEQKLNQYCKDSNNSLGRSYLFKKLCLPPDDPDYNIPDPTNTPTDSPDLELPKTPSQAEKYLKAQANNGNSVNTEKVTEVSDVKVINNPESEIPTDSINQKEEPVNTEKVTEVSDVKVINNPESETPTDSINQKEEPVDTEKVTEVSDVKVNKSDAIHKKTDSFKFKIQSRPITREKGSMETIEVSVPPINISRVLEAEFFDEEIAKQFKYEESNYKLSQFIKRATRFLN